MNTLANTTWTLKTDQSVGVTITLIFGGSTAPVGNSGGTGTMTINDPANPPAYTCPFVWVECGDGSFMLQLQNQNPGYSTLTTYAGTHANGVGTGWYSNFTVNFSKTKFTIQKS